ncbi:MAG: ABC transporter substrate-binding protein [Acidobacteriota bacterium]|nr:ABC transporter substrate-binding protein [Acidobacteriota bacterium]
MRAADAARVEASDHAKLVGIGAVRSLTGIINRDAEGLPFADKRGRQALNFAINRKRLVEEALFGYAEPLAGLTPPSAVTFLHRLSPYAYDPEKARELWQTAGGGQSRTIRVGTPDEWKSVAYRVAADLHEVLGLRCEQIIYEGAEKLRIRRALAEKRQPPEWDILLHEVGPQAADAPPLELHRAFAGAFGELRAGPIIPRFEALYQDLVGRTSPLMLAHVSYDIDKFVYEEALALFLCSPQALYAVNKDVEFTAYRTTFELAECEVNERHWSRRS